MIKRFIHWLAERTGVADEIRAAAFRKQARLLRERANWFTPTMLHSSGMRDVYNFMRLYPEYSLDKGRPYLTGEEMLSFKRVLETYRWANYWARPEGPTDQELERISEVRKRITNIRAR